MTDHDSLRTLAEAEAEKRRMFIDDDELAMFTEGFIAGRTSVTREQIEEVLEGWHFIEHGPGYGEHTELSDLAVTYFAEAVMAILRGETNE